MKIHNKMYLKWAFVLFVAIVSTCIIVPSAMASTNDSNNKNNEPGYIGVNTTDEPVISEVPETIEPTIVPSEAPVSAEPTIVPSEEPVSQEPTIVPSEEPVSQEPTIVPSEEPETPVPSEEPETPVPSEEPETPVPSEEPETPVPSEEPETPVPSEEPTTVEETTTAEESTTAAEETTTAVEETTTAAEETTVGLDEILDTAEPGDEIEIDMTKGDTVIKGEDLKKIAGKKITVEVKISDKVSWIINGEDIPVDWDPKDIDFNIDLDGKSSIPAELSKTITGQLKTIYADLSFNGKFGFKIKLRINIGKEYSGKYANVYYYNEETGKLELVESQKIDNSGNSYLGFSHASSYIITVTNEQQAVETTTVASQVNDSTPKTGDSGFLPIIMVGTLSIVVIIALAFKNKMKTV